MRRSRPRRRSSPFPRRSRAPAPWLQDDRPDDAIRVLERAVSLHPSNGENYFYLAEAWLAKKDTTQAEEFNRLAHLYLKGDVWKARVEQQRERITRGRW
jgi:predicted Zn-dependent protease